MDRRVSWSALHHRKPIRPSLVTITRFRPLDVLIARFIVPAFTRLNTASILSLPRAVTTTSRSVCKNGRDVDTALFSRLAILQMKEYKPGKVRSYAEIRERPR